MNVKKPRQARELSPVLLREVGGLALLALGGVAFLALLSATQGALSDQIALSLRRVFGWGGYPVAATLVGSGVFLLWKNLQPELKPPWQRIVGAGIVLLAALSISHLAAAPLPQGQALAQAGKGGGYVGWALSYLLEVAVGRVLAYLALITVTLAGVIIALQPSPHNFRQLWREVATLLTDLRRKFLSRVGSLRAFSSPKPSSRRPTGAEPSLPELELVPREQPYARRAERPAPAGFKVEMAKRQPQARYRRSRTLPPLDLLQPDASLTYDEAELQCKAAIIEETLESFGVPARVVEVRPGPTVTQFGVEPGYIERRASGGELQQWRVRINKITALADDLSLALAASPIRIEAPVPGRGVVGIEVPNAHISVVSLRGVVESQEFVRLRAPLRLALGRDVAGRPLLADLGRMPHLLIAGATGSGKSACINALICCLLLHHTPETLRLVLIDPKRVELVHYEEIPHLVGHVLHDVEEIIAAIKWVTCEMESRYRLFARVGARNLQAFNRKAPSLGEPRLPYLVIFVDEMAELMMISPEETERYICRIAQMARATGIHLVLSTQRPSVDVVTGLIKANFPARICFATTSQVDSRVVLDQPGAEKLLGRGDMLFMSPESSELTRAQGSFVSDPEIKRLADFWRDKTTTYLSLLDEGIPWAEAQPEEEDELLREAIALIRQHQQASASFLQRRLRIGYPRAARLVDLLEEKGIIGPPVAGGRSREVLLDDEEAND